VPRPQSRLGVLEGLDDVDRLGVGLLDRLAVVLAQTVQGVSALNGDIERRDVGDLDRVVLTGQDRLGEVAADLLGVDIERGDELDVAHVIVAQLDVHQPGDLLARVGVSVVMHALDERGGTVSGADDRNADLAASLRTHVGPP
jgi:hypothetical protein